MSQVKKLSSIDEIFSAFNSLKILIVGDVMIDSYLWGKVERISPEAPVPILNVQRREMRLGGAANVALNVQALGATPILCSIVGDDRDGEHFSDLLKKAELSSEGIITAPQRITTIKHRVMSGANHLIRVDQEDDSVITGTASQHLLEKIKKLIVDCNAIIFEDYDKGVLSKEVIAEIISLAQQKGIPTIVDPKKRNFLHYQGATLFKPNRKEISEGLKLDQPLSTPEQIAAAVKLLKEKTKVEGVLLTLSEKGVYIDHQGQQKLLPAHLREISDVSGAGDTVVSIAGIAVALGLSPELIAELSNLGGGLVCEQVGVVPIDKNLLQAEAKRVISKQ